MKKKKSDPPHDFVVEDADVAFGKLEDATRRILLIPKKEMDARLSKERIAKKKRRS